MVQRAPQQRQDKSTQLVSGSIPSQDMSSSAEVTFSILGGRGDGRTVEPVVSPPNALVLAFMLGPMSLSLHHSKKEGVSSPASSF